MVTLLLGRGKLLVALGALVDQVITASHQTGPQVPQAVGSEQSLSPLIWAFVRTSSPRPTTTKGATLPSLYLELTALILYVVLL